MDLVSSIRKEGSRGGVNFSWDDVSTSSHRENYLGHSLKAPVGRWQKGRDLNWYNKAGEGDGEDDGNSEEKKRKEEIRRIKEAEEDALARAMGLPVPDRNGGSGGAMGTGANNVGIAGEVRRLVGDAGVGSGDGVEEKGRAFGEFVGKVGGADVSEVLEGIRGADGQEKGGLLSQRRRGSDAGQQGERQGRRPREGRRERGERREPDSRRERERDGKRRDREYKGRARSRSPDRSGRKREHRDRSRERGEEKRHYRPHSRERRDERKEERRDDRGERREERRDDRRDDRRDERRDEKREERGRSRSPGHKRQRDYRERSREPVRRRSRSADHGGRGDERRRRNRETEY